MRALLDTCVILDVLQGREPFAADGQKIFLLAANRRFDGFLTANSMTDLYYLTRKLTHSDKETRQMLDKLLCLFDLIDTTAMDCRHALVSEMADFEDAVMVRSAVRCQLDCIVTRNMKDYAKAPIPVYLPAGFLERLSEEEGPI